MRRIHLVHRCKPGCSRCFQSQRWSPGASSNRLPVFGGNSMLIWMVVSKCILLEKRLTSRGAQREKMTKKATKKVTKKMALCSFSWYSPLEERTGRELHGWKIRTFLQTLINHFFFPRKHHQQCHPHSPLQQMKPWNQSLVALGRSAAPPCRLTSANLDFGFLNTRQQSQISPHHSSKMTVRGTMVRSEVCNSWCFCLES